MAPRLPSTPETLRRPVLGGPKPRGFEAQEKVLAAAVPGGERVPGSGCSRRPTRKGDVRGDHWLVEGKTTGAETISVAKHYLLKIGKEARDQDRLPAFSFGFDGEVRQDWFAFPVADAQTLMEIAVAAAAGDVATAQQAARSLFK